MTAIDFACPRCGVAAGDPCVDLRKKTRPERSRVHDERASLPGRRAAKCGTYSGAQRHVRKGEPLCEPCRVARARYIREWRQTTDADWRGQGRARDRATWALVDRHRDEFAALYAAEVAREQDGAA